MMGGSTQSVVPTHKPLKPIENEANLCYSIIGKCKIKTRKNKAVVR